MQGLPDYGKIFAHFAKNTLFLSNLPFSLPTPTPKWKVGQSLALWLLTTQEYPPPPENEKLARNWQFANWVLTTQEYPPHPRNGKEEN